MAHDELVPFYTREVAREAAIEAHERETIRVNSNPDADVLAVMTFKNLALHRAIKETGQTHRQIAEIVGISPTVISGYLTLRECPYNRFTKAYKTTARKLAEGLGRLVEDLFPFSLYARRLPKSLEAEIEGAKLEHLATTHSFLPSFDRDLDKGKLLGQVETMLGSLAPREDMILTLRFGLDGGGEHTLEEVGKVLNVSSNRVRQLEQRALRRMRHPSRSEKLRPFLDDDL